MPPPDPPAWRDKLSSLRVLEQPLFDQTFLAAWRGEPWQPNEADRLAATELHVQLISRITTQRLGYAEGNEAAALASVHQLFDKAREITSEHLGCRHVDTIAWHVINTRVRPFTAKWHRQSERGALEAVDATDVFRAELVGAQQALSRLDDLMVEIRDGRPAPVTQLADNERERRIAEAMEQPLPWGIDERLGGIRPSNARLINDAERRAIKARRRYYGRDEDKAHAVGLAISGGGIRDLRARRAGGAGAAKPAAASGLPLDGVGRRLSRVVPDDLPQFRPAGRRGVGARPRQGPMAVPPHRRRSPGASPHPPFQQVSGDRLGVGARQDDHGAALRSPDQCALEQQIDELRDLNIIDGDLGLRA
jgi:hypothetical protein